MPLSSSDFLRDPEVVATLDGLKEKFKNQKFKISDVTDKEGNHYVDLVQEGGGVLGIALVGYTYVLEQMGIRFFSLAGTSAGSINAMLLACCGNKNEPKSPLIIDHLSKLDMFSFVDGKPNDGKFTKWIKKTIISALNGGKVFKRMFNTIKWILLSLLLLTVSCFILNFFFPGVAKWIGVVAFALFVVLAAIIAVTFARVKKIVKSGYGINKGDVFHKWIKTILDNSYVENDAAKGGISSLTAFSQHFMRIPVLTVERDDRRKNNEAPHMPMLTLITCDIIAERKIEFPQMWDLYWKSENDVHPGDFVRASMSIPIFFETFCLNEIRKKSHFDKWNRHLNWGNVGKSIPDMCQFIDGGTLSNFPINVFYNPQYPVPRMPTFGIRLQDGILDAANRSNNNLFRYIASLFSTIRFNFDRDFITKNRAYNLGVKNIDVMEHSWLNFFMKDEEKITLFRKGAKAAADFLSTFDWENYKKERLKNFEMQEERFENPNNLEVFPFMSVGRESGDGNRET